jgi:hypothetical protein
VRKRVLMIAYLFPPAGGGGVQRTAGFARHLPDEGWAPTVLCGEATDYWAEDSTLLAGIDAPVQRVRLPGWDAARRWGRRVLPGGLRSGFDRSFVPDTRVGWIRPAVAAALRLHAQSPFDAVYSTGPPWTGHLVARQFARRARVAWVADFRDPWSDSPLQPPPRPLRPLHRALERGVHAEAALSVASTEGYRRRLQASFGLERSATLHLPNGFSEGDFADLPRPASDLRLGYAGSFYGTHSPAALFDALDRVHARRPELKLSVDLFGQTGPLAPRRFVVRRHGYVPQRAALQGLARSRVVFVTVPDVPGAEGCVPQKLYVYLRLGRPVLWCGPEGDATRILGAAGGTSFRLHPGRPDLEGLARWLAERATDDGRAGFDPSTVARYERRALTARLARALDGLAGRRPDARGSG